MGWKVSALLGPLGKKPWRVEPTAPHPGWGLEIFRPKTALNSDERENDSRRRRMGFSKLTIRIVAPKTERDPLRIGKQTHPERKELSRWGSSKTEVPNRGGPKRVDHTLAELGIDRTLIRSFLDGSTPGTDLVRGPLRWKGP